jgi:hypothetical protein
MVRIVNGNYQVQSEALDCSPLGGSDQHGSGLDETFRN